MGLLTMPVDIETFAIPESMPRGQGQGAASQ